MKTTKPKNTINTNIPTAIDSYIQKALARKQIAEPLFNNISKMPVSPINKDFTQITSILINSFSLNASNDVDQHGTSDIIMNSLENEEEKKQNTSAIATSVSIEGVKDTKRNELAKAISNITAKTIKSLGETLQPSQSIINIMIAFVVVIKNLSQDKLGKEVSKTYENSSEILKKAEIYNFIKNQQGIMNFLDSSKLEKLKKILKAKEKYLAGSDMKTSAISQNNQSARVILQFMLCLFDYIEVCIYYNLIV